MSATIHLPGNTENRLRHCGGGHDGGCIQRHGDHGPPRPRHYPAGPSVVLTFVVCFWRVLVSCVVRVSVCMLLLVCRWSFFLKQIRYWASIFLVTASRPTSFPTCRPACVCLLRPPVTYAKRGQEIKHVSSKADQGSFRKSADSQRLSVVAVQLRL